MRSIEEIVALRDITRNTVIRHIGKLVEHDRDNLPKHISPGDKILKELKNVLRKASDQASDQDYSADGELKVSWVYNKLKGKYPYDELNLAMLYVDPELLSKD